MSKPPTEVCEHIAPILRFLQDQGAAVTWIGTPWSRNCRTWVYVDRVIDLQTIREQLHIAACVVDHVHRGTHDGSEQGFDCSVHHDAVMGPHPGTSTRTDRIN